MVKFPASSLTNDLGQEQESLSDRTSSWVNTTPLLWSVGWARRRSLVFLTDGSSVRKSFSQLVDESSAHVGRAVSVFISCTHTTGEELRSKTTSGWGVLSVDMSWSGITADLLITTLRDGRNTSLLSSTIACTFAFLLSHMNPKMISNKISFCFFYTPSFLFQSSELFGSFPLWSLQNRSQNHSD